MLSDNFTQSQLCDNTFDRSSPSYAHLYQYDSTLKIASQNGNGWNEINYLLRENILLKLDFDVWVIVETRLKNDETIRVPGYKWIGQNRQK